MVEIPLDSHRMDKILARKLLLFVNDHYNQESLAKYVENRLNTLYLQLESTTESTKIYRIQGQIAEVKKLLTLREEVIKEAQ